jgi:hypothetical protein
LKLNFLLFFGGRGEKRKMKEKEEEEKRKTGGLTT